VRECGRAGAHGVYELGWVRLGVRVLAGMRRWERWGAGRGEGVVVRALAEVRR